MTYSGAIKYLMNITGKTEKEIINEIKRDLKIQNMNLKDEDRDRAIRIAVKKFVRNSFIFARVHAN